MLVWGLIVAIARLVPGETGGPIRFLAMAYSDIFRRLPAIITIYLIGFGSSLAEVPYSADSAPVFAILALTLVYGAYVAEVYGPASRACIGARRRGAFARALPASRPSGM